ncbi:MULTISPECIES: hypothetical protein [Thermus]|uniref:Uncharacterized protein n=2 Tax=Thermaceae TaxID=188786 RepID=A0A0N1KPM8_THESC|nr:hypothetical protein [Thermus scotoductus]KPD31092.1 hypothetical protein AN926_06580 [Thermus scotoductus]
MATVTASPKYNQVTLVREPQEYRITVPAEVKQALGLWPKEKLLLEETVEEMIHLLVEVVEGIPHVRPYRPPVRELLQKLFKAYPLEVHALGEATDHDAVRYVRKLRKA